MKPLHVRQAVYGLIRIHVAIQNALRVRIVEESFRLIGQFPYSLSQMISNCLKTPTDQEMHAIALSMPYFIKIMAENGEISDEAFKTG